MDFRTLLDSSFLLAETVTDMSGNQFLKKDLILDILASGNHIFFKEFFISASGNIFFSLEEKVLFLT